MAAQVEGRHASPTTAARTAAPAPFKCDGRTHCSQMTSCAEATHFIRHCPNTKMDGDNDGIPCEQQWCRN
ncbi:excalibur calcium-binding domain-containing protein [Marilutibacter maris]|nr:excalibur calcium-binding domain-containing protein [Lysobacter maris]